MSVPYWKASSALRSERYRCLQRYVAIETTVGRNSICVVVVVVIATAAAAAALSSSSWSSDTCCVTTTRRLSRRLSAWWRYVIVRFNCRRSGEFTYLTKYFGRRPRRVYYIWLIAYSQDVCADPAGCTSQPVCVRVCVCVWRRLWRPVNVILTARPTPECGARR